MMGFENSLQKLTITSYPDKKYDKTKRKSMEAMYNPSTIDLSYNIDYQKKNHINEAYINSNFTRLNPGTLQLELIFDATLPGNTESINDQLKRLRQLTTVVSHQEEGEYYGVPYLRITWGEMKWYDDDYLACRLESLAIHYSLFDRDATPIRATAALTLVCESNLPSKEPIKSPTSSIAAIDVPDMSPLPMVASALAAAAVAAGMASAVDYLTVAEENDLDNLDDYEAGDSMVSDSSGEGI